PPRAPRLGRERADSAARAEPRGDRAQLARPPAPPRPRSMSYPPSYFLAFGALLGCTCPSPRLRARAQDVDVSSRWCRWPPARVSWPPAPSRCVWGLLAALAPPASCTERGRTPPAPPS